MLLHRPDLTNGKVRACFVLEDFYLKVIDASGITLGSKRINFKGLRLGLLFLK